MSDTLDRDRFESIYARKPPWDIGRPQRAFVEVADRVTDRSSTSAAGPARTPLFFALRGHTVLGIDFLEGPIQKARRKAQERGLKAEFVQKDALTLMDLDRQFDAVIDSGLFHVFSDEDRARYVAGLAHVTRPGGRLFLLCSATKSRAPRGRGGCPSVGSGSRLRTAGRWRRSEPHGWRSGPTWRTFRSARAGQRRGSR